MEFCIGDKVEISSKEEGFMGSYYSATITERLREDLYKVMYKNLLKDDESGPLFEVVSADEIRPLPPKFDLVSTFHVSEKVDAFDNDGWWVGEVTSKRTNMYSVYFPNTGDEIVYPFRRLRPHLDWHDGEWVSSNNIVRSRR